MKDARLPDVTPADVGQRLEERLRRELQQLGERLPHDALMTRTETSTGANVAQVFRVATRRGLTWALRGDDALSDCEGARTATVGEALDYLAELVAPMAQIEAARLCAALELVHPPKVRGAVLERLRSKWPWLVVHNSPHDSERAFVVLRVLLDLDASHAAPRTDADTLRDSSRARPASNAWPSDVAMLDALEWVRDGLNRRSKGLGDAYKARAESIAAALSHQLAPVNVVLLVGQAEHLVSGEQLAWTYSAAVDVEKGQRVRAFKMPANKHSNAATAMLARPPTSTSPTTLWSDPTIDADRIIFTFAGKTVPYQLALATDDGVDMNAEIARGLVTQYGPDALRDWLALHRIATEQGSSGRFRWTWEEHRALTHYEERVRQKHASDDTLARATRKRIWLFKQTELWGERRGPDGRFMRARIGPHGLVDVDREILEADGATPAVVAGRFNPAIYGTKGKRAAAGFSLFPESVLRLPARELRLAAALFIALRANNDGSVRMKARTLWEHADLAESQRSSRRRWPQCRDTTHRALEQLAELGIHYTIDSDAIRRGTVPGALPDDVYTFTAPPWWTDRLLHGVGPILDARSTAGVPRTGHELAAARRAKGLTQGQVASVVGCSQQTVARLEKLPAALPAEWLRLLAAAKLTAR